MYVCMSRNTKYCNVIERDRVWAHARAACAGPSPRVRARGYALCACSLRGCICMSVHLHVMMFRLLHPCVSLIVCENNSLVEIIMDRKSVCYFNIVVIFQNKHQCPSFIPSRCGTSLVNFQFSKM